MYLDLPALLCMDLTRSFIWLADHCLEIEIHDDTTCSIHKRNLCVYMYLVLNVFLISLFSGWVFCSQYHFLFITTTTRAAARPVDAHHEFESLTEAANARRR